jgi:hypothetical protein
LLRHESELTAQAQKRLAGSSAITRVPYALLATIIDLLLGRGLGLHIDTYSIRIDRESTRSRNCCHSMGRKFNTVLSMMSFSFPEQRWNAS